MWRVAFDIGGTFTDFVLAGPDTPPRFLKVASSPDDPARAVIAGFERLLAEAGVAAAGLGTILHATTVATNAIIERKGCPTALLTTDGFRDVLIIGRQKRYETHDLYMTKSPPLVPRRRTFEVVERVDPHGAVEIPIDPASLDAAIDAVIASGAESVAVAFLHAYANPAHERAAAARLRERAPALPVSLSSKISPKFREYERTSTTVANAYVRPIVGRYIERLEAALAERGFENDMFIMQSAGGLVSPAIAAEEPARIVESGPAAGVLMSALVGTEAGESHVVTFDMGGTTAKLGAVDAGEPAVTSTFEIDPIRYRPGSGLPINIPAVELLEIGAGGGSIARAELGVIHVGPESAGADPGPMCYRRGGVRPTMTDANLVLGYLNPDYFNAGEMRLDREAAAAGLVRDIAVPLNLGVEGEPVWSRSGYLRYRGQGYEIRAEFPCTGIGDDFADVVAESFHAAYARSYGYRDDAAAIEAVDWHLTAILPAGAAELDLGWRAPEQGAVEPAERLAWFPETEGFAVAAVHDRRSLGVGTEIAGPAILEEPESTVVVPPGMTASVNRQGHVMIDTGVEFKPGA